MPGRGGILNLALRMGIGRARLVSSDINRRRDLDAVWILLRLSFHVTPWSPGEQTQATLVSPPAPGVPTTSGPSGASPRERMNGRALNSRGGSRGCCDQMTTNVMTEDGAQVSSRFKVGSQSRSRIEGRGGWKVRGEQDETPPTRRRLPTQRTWSPAWPFANSRPGRWGDLPLHPRQPHPSWPA